MLPQDGTYGGTPTPRNDSAASVSTAAANTNEACTMTGDRQFGSTWRATITRSETPSARAASTYVVSRMTRTEPRTIHDTAPDVAPHVVGAEPVRRAGRRQPRRDLHAQRVVGDQRREHAHHGRDGEQREAHDGGAATHQAHQPEGAPTNRLRGPG